MVSVEIFGSSPICWCLNTYRSEQGMCWSSVFCTANPKCLLAVLKVLKYRRLVPTLDFQIFA